MTQQYLFTSARLGFRNWTTADILPMTDINMDTRVMEFFPSMQGMEQTQRFIARMQEQFAVKGYCYYAVDRLDTGMFIGFIGLSEKTFPADFTPCIDIGWRLCSSEWNKGYATEGARRCLDHGFNTLGIVNIMATAPAINLKSVHIMQKAGMEKVKDFVHPQLTDDARLRDCVLYGAVKDDWH